VFVRARALPGMDGIRVLRQLRREGCASEIFLISAFVSDHMLAEATELRVDYFLPKPFAFEALFDRMRGAAVQSTRSALHPPSPPAPACGPALARAMMKYSPFII